MAPQDVFHAVLDLELTFLKGDFFDLFGFGEVVLGGQLVESIFEFVVLDGQLREFRVRLQQLCSQILRLDIHTPPPWTSIKRGILERWSGPCGCMGTVSIDPKLSHQLRPIQASPWRHSTSASSTGWVDH